MSEQWVTVEMIEEGEELLQIAKDLLDGLGGYDPLSPGEVVMKLHRAKVLIERLEYPANREFMPHRGM